MHYDKFTSNDYQNEIAYLRQALIQASRSMQSIRDNVGSGRFSITVLDDGKPHAANIGDMLDNLKYVDTCLEQTNPYTTNQQKDGAQ